MTKQKTKSSRSLKCISPVTFSEIILKAWECLHLTLLQDMKLKANFFLNLIFNHSSHLWVQWKTKGSCFLDSNTQLESNRKTESKCQAHFLLLLLISQEKGQRICSSH